jgi:hypothetical protein
LFLGITWLAWLFNANGCFQSSLITLPVAKGCDWEKHAQGFVIPVSKGFLESHEQHKDWIFLKQR